MERQRDRPDVVSQDARPRPRRLFCRRCHRQISAGQAVARSRGWLVHASCSSAAVIATVLAASAGQQ
jgi:hypothetical protein